LKWRADLKVRLYDGIPDMNAHTEADDTGAAQTKEADFRTNVEADLQNVEADLQVRLR
jgi:hypothetical protein